MREDSEFTPFLRGRGTGQDLSYGSADAGQQAPAPREGQQLFSREQEQLALLPRARSRPLLLAVTAAVAAAALVVVGGVIASSGHNPQGGSASLAAATSREISGGSAGHAGGQADGEARAGERRGAGSDERHGSEGSGGGWRSHADRSSGIISPIVCLCRFSYVRVCMDTHIWMSVHFSYAL